MVYFCAWGPDCERVHDIADEVIATDDMGERRFAGPNEQDTIMTTWHNDELLDDALNFFVTCSHPTEGFEADANYWLAISVGNPEWTRQIRRYFEENLR